MKLTPLIQKAINYAAKLHAGQVRKASIELPYISHPYSVAWIVADYCQDEEVIAAALLHDVIEDVAGYSLAALELDFGPRVASLVQSVSEVDKSVGMSQLPWRERKDAYLANLKTNEEGALYITAADKIHNLQSLIEAYLDRGEQIWSDFHSPADSKLWFYHEVLLILEKRLASPIVAELAKVYEQAVTVMNIKV
ncbi:MAG: HD domain-containing protein [Candidatus Falkowbacteria bacterium]